MAGTSGRMLQLLSLLQSRERWTGPALAAELGVSVRTVRRDVDTLRGVGYTVDVTRGAGGRYSLGSGRRLPPLVFDEEQAVAIAVALQAVPRSIRGLEQAAGRALDTMLEVLPARVRHQAAGLRITTVESLWDLAAPAVPMRTLTDVSAAIDRHESLRYDLAGTDPGGPVGPARLIEPHHLVSWSGRWCLIGWDPQGDAWCTLRLDRVSLRTPNGPRFTEKPIPGGDVTAFFDTRTDRGDDPDRWPCAGSATVEQPAGLIARYAPGGTLVQELGPTTSRVTLGAWSWNGIAALLGSFDAVVSDARPAELGAACRELAARYR